MLDSLIGRQLGQYHITALIGRGGMAVVYRAYQASMNREVAIKVVGNQSDDLEFVSRFEREASVIAQLEHPHILPVYDFGRTLGVLYLAMRLVEGGSLDSRLRIAPLPVDQAARMFTAIASALTYAHQHGVIHRDIKPNNILLDTQDYCYLADFGLAKTIQHTTHLTASGSVMGTPSYMSPEQWRSENVDQQADIYALGVMLYEMLTGKLPFESDTPFGLMYLHLDSMPTPPHTLNPALPEKLNDVISKALAKKPADRYASADAMAHDLNAILAGNTVAIVLPPHVTKRSPQAEQAQRIRSKRLRFLVVMLLAMVSALFGLTAGFGFILYLGQQRLDQNATATQRAHVLVLTRTAVVTLNVTLTATPTSDVFFYTHSTASIGSVHAQTH